MTPTRLMFVQALKSQTHRLSSLAGIIIIFSVAILLPRLTAQETSDPKIPPQAIEFKDSFYLFIPKQMSYNEAKEWCESKNGQLVAIESRAEDQFIGRLTDFQPVLIGARWDRKLKIYKWSNGNPAFYENVALSARTEKKDHICLIKNRKTGGNAGGEWYPAHPNAVTANGFVCEW
ncbi:MAG: C-type lectin domain-containing protein [Verrucomicrobiota bacterium]